MGGFWDLGSSEFVLGGLYVTLDLSENLSGDSFESLTLVDAPQPIAILCRFRLKLLFVR